MAVTLARAQELFSLCLSRLCCPCSGAAPGIAFLYPEDGCWARANEMCRLMIAEGEQPSKVWLRGRLHTLTRNSPKCYVDWGYHVAPTLEVSVAATTQTYVIDPSLFDGPVPLATWRSVQGDPSATATITAASQYGPGGGTDPTYSQTQIDLETYRNVLRLRSVGADGPPPYTACVIQPQGTQWYGLIEPNQTQLWFTWGWPSDWNVLWHVMPMTPCPYGTRLTWDVTVERASGGDATYWIKVINPSPERVRFEGRFDVLS